MTEFARPFLEGPMPYVKPVISSGHTLIAMVGLPRSGKSTWAKATGYPIVNRDAIRLALHGERFISDAEALVKVHALYMIKSLFLAGNKIVILDETNTTRARRDFWVEAGKWTTYFKAMTVGADRCKERAKDDGEILGVIDRMDKGFDLLDVGEIRVEDNSDLHDMLEYEIDRSGYKYA